MAAARASAALRLPAPSNAHTAHKPHAPPRNLRPLRGPRRPFLLGLCCGLGRDGSWVWAGWELTVRLVVLTTGRHHILALDHGDAGRGGPSAGTSFVFPHTTMLTSCLLLRSRHTTATLHLSLNSTLLHTVSCYLLHTQHSPAHCLLLPAAHSRALSPATCAAHLRFPLSCLHLRPRESPATSCLACTCVRAHTAAVCARAPPRGGAALVLFLLPLLLLVQARRLHLRSSSSCSSDILVCVCLCLVHCCGSINSDWRGVRFVFRVLVIVGV